MIWNDIYNSLRSAWDAQTDRTIPPPPIPLILNGWVFSSNKEKADRWIETIKWAKVHGMELMIPKLSDEESYFI
jgi:hypothetical protein